jgi:diguanylate cyclase (GGDEF)-like protein/PAS domain S-box-containing protein
MIVARRFSMDRIQEEAIRRVHAQQAALFELLKTGVTTAGAKEAFRAVTEACAKTLEVRRASVWLLSPDYERLVLQDLYDRQDNRHLEGVELDAQAFPAYFHALRWSRAIVAADAVSDPRTSELAGEYLARNRIVSMLDAGIWQAGRAKGVVCVESVGERREWATDEQQFAGSIADLAVMALTYDSLRDARQTLQETEELFERVVASSPDWIALTRISDGRILHVNAAFEAQSGYSAADVVGRTTVAVGIWSDPKQRAAWIERVRTEERVSNFEVEFRTRSGALRTFELSGHRVDIKGEDCVVSISRDVTERKRQERLMEHLALYDSLTGLPNRILLKQRIEESLPSAGALLLIDLDRFKEVNDTLGHHVGDILLTRIAQRLATEMGAGADRMTARLGGDEFAIWLGDVAHEPAAEALAARALTLLTTPVELEGYRLELGASIGIAMAPAHADTASGLLRCADVAMYTAKREGTGFDCYEASQDPYTAMRLTLLTELAGAVRRGEMRVEYQPRVSLATNTLWGFEALVRWDHPRLGRLPPTDFIPLAELSDAIRALTRWVLEAALEQQRAWREAGHATRMAVNLSARHLMDDSCPEQVERMLEKHGIAPELLELEITESALIHDPERAARTLQRIRALGVQISVDDFGTGFSSLSHLKRLPLHALKIDVGFVRGMLANAQDRVIVDATIALAHNLGLTVVAEGIEDEATLDALRARGCDDGQGFHIAAPLDARSALAFLEAA